MQFLAIGVLAIAVLVVGSQWLSKRAAVQVAVSDSRRTTQILASSVVQPALRPGITQGQAAALDKFDRVALHRLIVGDVLRIKIWDQSGRIVYSDQTQLIGERFSLGADEQAILAHGGIEAEVSDLSKPENRFERRFGQLLEVYTRVHAPDGQPLLFEAYFSYADINRRSAQILNNFRPITVGALLVFLILAGLLVWLLARRLDAAARDRERLLLAAVNASDDERRRIARDLHDGVVQDLAGTSFALSATAQEAAGDLDPAVTAQLESLGSGIRNSLRDLRSLLVEIYPPTLRSEGLAAGVDDLAAPAIARGIAASTSVELSREPTPEVSALVWRVAQEAVRNAVRHAHATRLDLTVREVEDKVLLEVRDNGTGFDPQGVPAGHLGLRGLRDLVSEAGGELQIESSTDGTLVQLKVRSR